MEYNELEALEGALLGIHGLQRLSLNNNKLKNIAPDDLIGLEDLRLLDVSHNHLKTLEETSKVGFELFRKNICYRMFSDFPAEIGRIGSIS